MYRITNRTSGHVLGVYPGATPSDAIAAMHRDAGYADSNDAAAALGVSVRVLLADLLVSDISAGALHDYQTGEELRPATVAETVESREAGAEGVILVDGRPCYVAE